MTKKVFCGNVQIGGGAPVSIQSMCNVDTRDKKAVVRQIKELADAGCEIIRLAVPDMEAAEAFRDIKKMIKAEGADIPVVADIHFDYRLAIAAMENGADKIRINPGNIGSIERVQAVVNKAKEYHVPIRVGVNSGSLEKDILERDGRVTAQGLADSAMRNVKLLEDMDFEDIVISLKSSNVQLNFDAYRIVAERMKYPLHIGVTEAGTIKRGKVKSAAGIGALLLCGIGDTLRVSLTANPVEEVYFAKELLHSLDIRQEGIEIVSCPTCGRTRINLEKIAEDVEKAVMPLSEKFSAQGRKFKIAVMGCAVNGPGEAREADLGVAGGEGKGVIFAKGQIIKTVDEADIIKEIVEMTNQEL